MNSRFLIQSEKLFSKFSSARSFFYINSKSLYYAAHPYPNGTIKKLMKFLKDNKEELDYVPPLPKTSEELNRISDEVILNLTVEEEKKLKFIKWEYELLKESSPYRVPEDVNSSDWMKLLEKESTTQRRNFLKSLRLKEKAKNAEKEKKTNTERTVRPSQLPVFQSKLFLWLHNSTINTGFNERICESLMNGPHCVVDMGFENLMEEREVKNTISQLINACSHNKHCAEPFHLTFTDLEKDKYSHIQLSHYLPKCYIKTEANFMDIFPSENLIYLTPDSPNEMKVYDPEAIYIIGGMVDLSSRGAVTLAKAKKLQIRTARFPIDRYLLWEKGSKYLTLNQVFSILHTIKDSGDWLQAFRHIPQRKLKKPVLD